MAITATEPIAAPHETSEVGLVESARAVNLNVETVTSNPLLPTDRKWAIRFNAGGTVTIILGMKDYGRGWFSAYFTGLAAARNPIPVVPRLLHRRPPRGSADPYSVSQCVPSMPYRSDSERGRRCR
jgi:hypothetical protein